MSGAGGMGSWNSVGTSSPLNFIARNTDGSSIVGPATGTVTITFSVSISAMDTSGPDGFYRFEREGSLGLSTTYVDIGVGPTAGGVVVTDHATGVVLASDPNFNDLVSGGGGGDPGDLSFSWSGNFPISQVLSISYGSDLQTNPNGTFNGETASYTADFDWSFSVTANP
jgi:hypothetical protein